MGIYDEAIADKSVWLTATPGEKEKGMPYYIMEIGHFYAYKDYEIKRVYHDSFLLLYTVKGEGAVVSDTSVAELDSGKICIIDCHRPHRYYSKSDEWEFIWFHFNGTGADILPKILYKDGFKPTLITDRSVIESSVGYIMKNIKEVTLSASFNISLNIHKIINAIIDSETKPNQNAYLTAYEKDINTAIEYIKSSYQEPITLDDILSKIHISKFHFIRVFHKVTGMSPYGYITGYRINQAKIMLHSTDKTVSEISHLCGYDDTSNFINHFKKQTGQTPLQYRKTFA